MQWVLILSLKIQRISNQVWYSKKGQLSSRIRRITRTFVNSEALKPQEQRNNVILFFSSTFKRYDNIIILTRASGIRRKLPESWKSVLSKNPAKLIAKNFEEPWSAFRTTSDPHLDSITDTAWRDLMKTARAAGSSIRTTEHRTMSTFLDALASGHSRRNRWGGRKMRLTCIRLGVFVGENGTVGDILNP